MTRASTGMLEKGTPTRLLRNTRHPTQTVAKCPHASEGIFNMGFIQGEDRTQGMLFPVVLDELIPQDHVCRVIDAFVDRLNMAGLGVERADPADKGRAWYDPREIL